LTIGAGVGYAFSAGEFVHVAWNDIPGVTAVGQGYNYIYIKPNGSLTVVQTQQNPPVDIYIGAFWYILVADVISVIWNTPEWAGNYSFKNNNFVKKVFKTLIASGFEVTEQAVPNQLKLSIAAGVMFINLTEFDFPASTSLIKICKSSDWDIFPTTDDPDMVDTTRWNDTTLDHLNCRVEMTNGYWKKDLLVMNPGGTVYYIWGTSEYPTEDAALGGSLPSYSDAIAADGNAFLFTIVSQKGDTSISNRLHDIRHIMDRAFEQLESGTLDYNNLINKPEHNQLDNIQGGQAAERYHLDVAQYNNITAGSYQYSSLMSNYQSAGNYINGISLSGNNTSGTMAAIVGGTVYLAGGNNVTLSQNSNSITISTPTAGGAQTGISGIAGSAASTVTQGTVQFANGNGISFGLNGSTMTASHNALTTAMASDAGSNFIYASAAKNLTNISATLASNAVSFSVGNYLTTAMASNANTSFVGLNSAATNITWTVNSSGISLSNPGWLTTAMASNANTSFVGLNTAQTNITWTVNSSGISLSNPGWLTTAAQSGHTHGSLPSITGNISVSSNSNAWSISISNYLTTAMASNANTSFVGLNSAATNITWTVNSSGISLSNPGWLTTAMLSNANTSFVGAGAAFSGVNATGTINSTGITVSVAAPGAAAENNWHTLAGNVVGNSSASGSTIQLYGGNNITLSGLNNSQIRIDAAAGGGGVTFHLYEPFERNNTGTIQSNATLFLSPVSINQYVTATRGVMIASIAESVNATLSEKATVSVAALIYSLSNDSIRLQTISSGSQSYSFNVGSGSSTNSVSFTGYRNFTIPINVNATPGLYWIGMWSMTSISAIGATNNSIAFTMQGVAPRATAWYANDLSLSNNSVSTTGLQLPGHGYVTVSRSNTNLSLPVFIARSTAAGATTNADVSFGSRVPYIALKDFDFPIMSN
jgi:hypothetical protein